VSRYLEETVVQTAFADVVDKVAFCLLIVAIESCVRISRVASPLTQQAKAGHTAKIENWWCLGDGHIDAGYKVWKMECKKGNVERRSIVIGSPTLVVMGCKYAFTVGVGCL